MDVAVLGLGEAGRVYATDLLSNGVSVRGFDIRQIEPIEGLTTTQSIEEAVQDVDLVLSLTTTAGAMDAAQSARSTMRPDAIFADLNAASPALMASLADVIGRDRFVDVAILTPARRHGLRSHLLASGEAAVAFAALFKPFDVPLKIVPGPAGVASRWKLLRSVFMKSLAAAILESRAAAVEAGCEDWLLAEIASELGENGSALVDRMIVGTGQHAARRVTEMQDARACMVELGAPTDVTDAAITWLRAVAAGQRA